MSLPYRRSFLPTFLRHAHSLDPVRSPSERARNVSESAASLKAPAWFAGTIDDGNTMCRRAPSAIVIGKCVRRDRDEVSPESQRREERTKEERARWSVRASAEELLGKARSRAKSASELVAATGKECRAGGFIDTDVDTGGGRIRTREDIRGNEKRGKEYQRAPALTENEIRKIVREYRVRFVYVMPLYKLSDALRSENKDYYEVFAK